MFEVKYLWNRQVKKDGVNANLILCYLPNFTYPIDFAFSPRLNITSDPEHEQKIKSF